jgi:two-component system response regulator WspF
MRIGIVNDLSLAVEALRRVILMVENLEIAWVAYDGKQAVELAIKDRPDLILMDLIMPVMDGVQATAEIMKKSPCAILVVTASVGGNSSKVFEAMGHGALDAVATPVFDFSGNATGAR